MKNNKKHLMIMILLKINKLINNNKGHKHLFLQQKDFFSLIINLLFKIILKILNNFI